MGKVGVGLLKRYLTRIFSVIVSVLLTIGIYILIAVLQTTLFVPTDYSIWVFKSPISRLSLIYMLYSFGGFALLFNKEFREMFGTLIKGYNRKLIFIIFGISNLVIFYVIVTDVTIVTNNKIIDYSFSSPQGRIFRYADVVKIDTGVYGTRRPLMHSKGDFYYIIELHDGTKLDLEDVGGVKNDESEYFVIERIDRQLVNLNVPKVSSMDNFQYATKHLDSIYTDKIRAIIENTKGSSTE